MCENVYNSTPALSFIKLNSIFSQLIKLVHNEPFLCQGKEIERNKMCETNFEEKYTHTHTYCIGPIHCLFAGINTRT